MTEKNQRYRHFFKSPIGMIELTATESALLSLYFRDSEKMPSEKSTLPLLLEAEKQLNEYFNGTRCEFDLPLLPQGTDFQMRVWRELQNVQFGKTVSYQDIAVGLGDKNAVRAVGNANGKNPISVIIPCHRVIGRDGSLIGYGGGIWRKEWLLKHEGALII